MKAFVFCFSIFLIGVLGAFLPADAAVNLLTGVNRDTLTIGDPIVLRMRLTRGQDDQVLVVPSETFPQPFEIRERRPITNKSLPDGRVQETHDWVLTIYQIGEFSVPPIGVQYTTAQGDSGRIESQAIPVVVLSVKPEGATDIRDVKPPAVIEPQIPFWAWLALAGGAILLVLLIFYLRHRRKRPRVVLPPPPVDWEAEIQKIAALGLIEQKDYRQFYSLLSETLRRCLEAKTPVRAVEQTTFEIVGDLHHHRFDDEVVRDIERFLTEADMVKFAKFQPEESAGRLALDIAGKIVGTVVRAPHPESVEDVAL